MKTQGDKQMSAVQKRAVQKRSGQGS